MSTPTPTRPASRPRDPKVRTKGQHVSTRAEDRVRDPGIYYVESPGAGGVISSTRLDPAMKARVQEVVQCGKFPFDSENKLLRAALHYFMEKVIGPKMHSTFQDDLRLASMQQQLLKATSRLASIRRFVVSTAEALNNLFAAGQGEEATAVWHRVNITMARMEEPYRTMYREAFGGDSYPEWSAVREGLGLKVMGPKRVKELLGSDQGAI